MSARNHDSKGRRVSCQRRRLIDTAGTAWSSLLKEMGVLSRIVECLKDEVGTWRERRYGPLTTLVMFIGQVMNADQSCQDAVARETARSQGTRGTNTGSYCKARQRLPLRLIERLGPDIGERLRQKQPHHWCWRGREVKLIDGTTVSMPDTKSNQARFPQSRTQKAGLGFPVARLLAVVSLSCGAVLEWMAGPCEGKGSGETSMLWKLAGGLRSGDVVLADRYYAGYFMLARLMGCGVDIVVRQHQLRRTDFRRGKRLGKCDHLVEWPRGPRPAWMDQETYAAMPERLTLREVRVGNWIIVSSLRNVREVSRRELSDLYQQRWQVELDLRSIKSVMQMDIVRCLSPGMVVKEIAVHLLAYNLVRTAMGAAARAAELHPRRLSFKGALQLLRAYEGDLAHGPASRVGSRYDRMIRDIAANRLPHRPGRVEPRVKKRRPKSYPLMTRPRNQLRIPLTKQMDRVISLLR